MKDSYSMLFFHLFTLFSVLSFLLLAVLEILLIKYFKLCTGISAMNIIKAKLVCLFFLLFIFETAFQGIYPILPFKEYGSVAISILLLFIAIEYWVIRINTEKIDFPLFKIVVFINCISFLPGILLWEGFARCIK